MSVTSEQLSNEIIDPCPICINTYTKTLRKEIKCQFCNASTCAKCIESYLLSSIEDPHCVHCRRAWSRSVLSGICTKTFLNHTYFKFRQGILLNREKSFMPQFQLQAEREKRALELIKDDIVLAKKYNVMHAEYNAQLTAISTQRILIARRVANARAGRDEEGASTDVTVAERSKFVRRCTFEGCKGFLSSVWKCGICANWVCPDCFEVKGLDKDIVHVCNKDMLDTANLIKKDTKPCPSCGEMIMKIEGCDQMFCTACHNPFSWISGKVITMGTIHNPHYFQWLARGGNPIPRNQHDVPCGGLPDAYQLRRSLLRILPELELNRIMAIFRTCAHTIDVERNRHARHLTPTNNQDIGIQYMLNSITEDEWKRVLAKRERDRQKSNEIRDVLDAFNGASIDLFRRIEVTPAQANAYTLTTITPVINGLLLELEALRQFTMDALCDISRSFNCSIPMITADWKNINGKSTLLFPVKKRMHAADAVVAAAGAGTSIPDISDSDSCS